MKNQNAIRNLGWGDRFALIAHFNPSDEQICEIFGVTVDELETAREIRNTGERFTDVSEDLNVTEFATAFQRPSAEVGVWCVTNGSITHYAPSRDAARDMKRDLGLGAEFKVGKTVDISPAPTTKPGKTKKVESTTTHQKPVNAKGTPPETATKPTATPKKRGRKGSNILTAFQAVPAKPVSVDAFARKHNVSIAVLRQSKRFDKTGLTGTVRVKKDKDSHQLMIWRDSESA